MLRTRLVVGLILAALAFGVLVGDWYLYPWYPFLLVAMAALAVLACREMLELLAPEYRPPRWLCTAGVLLVTAANWPAFIIEYYHNRQPGHSELNLNPWFFVLGAFLAVVVAAFLYEMARFREPGHAVPRMALLVWTVAYLALLPSFMVQACWPPVSWSQQRADFFHEHLHGPIALALIVFVPKCGDIGAYMFGRFLGRHRMTPVLSPKKTWEGFAGGLLVSVLVAVAVNRGLFTGLGPVLLSDLPNTFWPDLAAAGLGLTVGVAGVLGDLAESLVKRDCQRKDASASIPGFGGVLDVIDSVIFAAPVAFLWLRFLSVSPGAPS